MKTAVVTGSSGGIGAAICGLLSSEGWRVHGIDRRQGPADLVDREWQVDLGNAGSLEGVIERIRDCEDRLDLLVHAAARQDTGPLETLDPSSWDESMAVNVRSLALLAAGLKRPLAAAAGSIVAIGSVHSLVTSPGMPAYVASKGALTSLVRALALEIAPDGIRVNAVLPGAIDTPMLASGLSRGSGSGIPPEEARERLIRATPLGRLGDPQDVARAVAFLADREKSGFVTGQSLVVDGGASCQLATEVRY